MDSDTRVRSEAGSAAASPDSLPSPLGRAAAMVVMLGSGLASQTGAAVGAMAFPVLGPVGVVAVRQWVAAVILLAVGRPRLRSFTWWQWRPVLALAAVFATMNVALYSAIDRVGLGMAVTLEFLGPLSVAVAGALTVAVARRRLAVLACVALAVTGVVVLTRPLPTTDYLGVGLGLLAALCWAGYILLNRTMGQRVPGVQGSAAAGALSALVYVPIGIATLVVHPPTPTAIACAAAAGLLSSAVPFVADLLVLRRVPAHFFGIFMSVNPVLAAAVGAVVLGEALGLVDWLAIALIVAANAIAVSPTLSGSVPRGTG
ncbi:MAG TPA: EamA family transporter [Pseudonocardia sp.]